MEKSIVGWRLCDGHMIFLLPLLYLCLLSFTILKILFWRVPIEEFFIFKFFFLINIPSKLEPHNLHNFCYNSSLGNLWCVVIDPCETTPLTLTTHVTIGINREHLGWNSVLATISPPLYGLKSTSLALRIRMERSCQLLVLV